MLNVTPVIFTSSRHDMGALGCGDKAIALIGGLHGYLNYDSLVYWHNCQPFFFFSYINRWQSCQTALECFYVLSPRYYVIMLFFSSSELSPSLFLLS